MFSLAKTDILKITGDSCLTDINFMTVLNYLEIEKDYNEEQRKAEQRMMQRNR